MCVCFILFYFIIWFFYHLKNSGITSCLVFAVSWFVTSKQFLLTWKIFLGNLKLRVQQNLPSFCLFIFHLQALWCCSSFPPQLNTRIDKVTPVPAQAAFTRSNSTTEWKPVTVTDYFEESNTYFVQWTDTGQVTWLPRQYSWLTTFLLLQSSSC